MTDTSLRWLLLVHQLPATPSNLRVRTWRRLQQIGALPVKQAVYALPDLPGPREDLEWLKAEIDRAGGQATVFTADAIDSWSNDALVEEFRRSRQAAYDTLARDAERVLSRMTRGPKGTRDVRKPIPSAAPLVREVRHLAERFAAIERIDFFDAPGREQVDALLRRIQERLSPATPTEAATTARDKTAFARRTWVTRPRPAVDRMASAWLIRRFIDPRARFAFVADRAVVPAGGVAFDMFGGEFTHRGDQCTFEVLCSEFGLQDASLQRIAAIVHDVDLKDTRFGAPEAAAIGLVIEGLRLAHIDDAALLTQGMALFEALYRAFAAQQRASRTVDRRRGRPPARKRR